MCNSYQIGRKGLDISDLGAIPLLEISALIRDWETPRLIRPTLKAPVVLTGGGAELMRWGFERPWSKSINNARSDKLASPMWKESFETRRCLIPMDGFFEYSGPAGHKQAHWFHSPSGGWLWGAGIWEPHQDLGPCYSMIMTEATGIVTPIHDRMPVLIAGEYAQRYLSGGSGELTFPPVALAVEEAENPLKGAKPGPPTPVQGELFGEKMLRGEP